jgi:sugar phosphate permease
VRRGRDAVGERWAYVAWFLLSAAFAYQYVLRTYPGVFIREIRVDFQMSAREFARISSHCLYAYALLQIPMGLLLDRFGVRVVALGSFVALLVGHQIFISTRSTACAQLGRTLLGAGSACMLIGSMKMVNDNFPIHVRSVLMGLTLVINDVVVIGASRWLAAANTNWRTIVNVLQYAGYALFLVALLALRPRQTPSENAILRDIWTVVKNKKIVLYGILSVGVYSSVAAISDFWGVGFLVAKFGLSKLQATQLNTIIFIGFGVGGVLIPLFFGFGKRALRAVRYGSLLVVVLFAYLLYGRTPTIGVLQIVMFALGFLACLEVLCFVMAAQLTNGHNSGLISGWVNTFNMLGGAAIQQAIGGSLDLQWNGSLDASGIRLYDATHYQNAFLIPLAVVCACFVVACGMRSRHHSLESRQSKNFALNP